MEEMTVKALKQIVSIPVDWVVEKLRQSEQGRSIHHILTPSQKQLIKKLIGFGKTQARWEVGKAKQRLYDLGFTERGLADLQEMYDQHDNPYLRKFAAWELMMWYANQYSPTGARQCLKVLSDAVKGEKDPNRLRKATVVSAECFDLLGKKEEAKRVVARALESDAHADLYLAAANLESSITERLKWINKAFRIHGISELSELNLGKGAPYDELVSATVKQKTPRNHTNRQPKVSVIIPAYNAETVILTSLSSVLAQTWTNLEVLVVDDGSTDNTSDIVESVMAKDTRVRLIKAKCNRGAYVARNIGLKEATGDFVTVNDADDWSHPEKIERQVRHLIEHRSVIANSSEQARATEELRFCRRFNSDIYVQSNLSSLMFRREPVQESIGYWDSVRFGADSEFKRRIKKIFGEKAVVDLKTGPLSFQRQSENSLTSDSSFGYHGFKYGARKEYAEGHDRFHAQASRLYIDFPLKKRPFAVPEPMKPDREVHPTETRHFDVIIASDFRLPGGNTVSNVEEIKAQKRFGLRTGLIQMYRYDLRVDRKINPKIRRLLDEDNGHQVQMLVHGEHVTCDVLIVRHPPVLQERQRYLPKVKAKQVNVIVNQPPLRDYSKDGERLYDIERCTRFLQELVGQSGKWYPIGPQVRRALIDHHASELEAVDLASEDWVNIIDVHEWRRESRPQNGSKIRIGRHSRDHYVKWPSNKDELLQVYPDEKKYEIHVLGGANAPKRVLGKLPANWHVLEFGAMPPREFLSTLDVFVYFTHPDWVESFGRVIFEAMAVGVPVIIPHTYRDLFGEAAIYAQPFEVKEKIEHLMRDPKYYHSQVEKAYDYVERHFGYSKHAARLGIGEHGLL